MFSSKLLFIFLLVFISICHALPTNSFIEKEIKNSSVQVSKLRENIPDKAKTNLSQVVIPDPKALNGTVMKETTQEEKSPNKENDKITSEKADVDDGKDSQKTLDSSQKNSQVSKVILEDKTNKESQIQENEVKEKERITEKSGHQQMEDEIKEKSDKKEPEKVLKDNLNKNLELTDDAKQADGAKPEIENQSPVEDVIPDKESTFKITDKEENKSENQVKVPQLYNPDINISDEKDKIKEENYDEYDEDGFQENKSTHEKESSISNNPSGYIPNKNLGIIDDANSHFFAYLVTLMVLVVLFYLLFHNKQRIIALMIEGRGSRPSRRGARAKYHKLDNNLEEAMGSLRSGGGASLNNIY